MSAASLRARRTGVVLTGGTVGSAYLEDEDGGDATVSFGGGPASVPAPEFDLLTRSDPFGVREIAVRRP